MNYNKASMSKIQILAQWIKESNYTVIFTGAGMSTESGIPDFRSQDGLWKNIDPMKFASEYALCNDYDNFYLFYKMRIESLEECTPHKGYNILAHWEKRGILKSILTQNVDGFHELAGNGKVYKLHGSINTFRCNNCQKEAKKESFLKRESCTKCRGLIRPNVVLFGETLPQVQWNSAMEEMSKAELVIVIGTSLVVYPVNQLPEMTRGKKVYINQEITENNSFELNIKGRAGEILQEVEGQLILY